MNKMKLGDILEIQPKSKRKAGEGIINGKYPFYTCSNELTKSINTADYEGDALIMGTGGMASIHYEKGKFSTSTDCLVYKSNKNVNLSLINKYLRTNIYLLENGFKGAGLRHISRDYISNITIPLPERNLQDKIVTELDLIEKTITNHNDVLKKYDTLIKSRFIEMFGDPVENPKQWIIEKLKSLTSKIGSGATPKGGRESYISEGISLVRSMNVYNGFFEYEGLAHITEAQAKELDNVTLQENDVLFNITGASVARCCILPKDVLPARVNQHVSILRTTEKLNPVYLSNLLISDTEQRVLLGIGGAGGATREAITKTELESLDIPVPPLELQQQFAAFVQQIDKSKFAVQKSLEKAETLYKSLMQEYFG